MYKKGSELDNDSISSFYKPINNDSSNFSILKPSPPYVNSGTIQYNKSPPLRSPRKKVYNNSKSNDHKTNIPVKKNDAISLMYQKLLKNKKDTFNNKVTANNSLAFNNSSLSKHSQSADFSSIKSQSLSKIPGGYLIKELMSGSVYINDFILDETDSTTLSLCRMVSQFRTVIISIGLLLDSCIVLTLYINQPSNVRVKTIPSFKSYTLLLKIWRRTSYKKGKEKLSLWVCSCSSAIICDNVIQSIIFDEEQLQSLCWQEIDTIRHVAAVKIQLHIRKFLAIKRLYISKFLAHRVEQGRLVAGMRADMWKQAITIANDETDKNLIQNYMNNNSKIRQSLPPLLNIPDVARMQKIAGKPIFKNDAIDMNMKGRGERNVNVESPQQNEVCGDADQMLSKDNAEFTVEQSLQLLKNSSFANNENGNSSPSRIVDSTGRNVHIFFRIDEISVSHEDILSLQSEIVKIVEFSKISDNELRFKTSVNEHFEVSLKFMSLQQDIITQRSVLHATEILAEHKEKEEKILQMRRREEIQKKKREEIAVKLKAHEIHLAEQRGALITMQHMALEQERKQKISAELRKRREESKRIVEEKKLKDKEEKIAADIRLELETNKYKMIRDVMASNYYEKTDMRFASEHFLKARRKLEERMKIKIREELEQERLELEREQLEEQEKQEEKERRREERQKEKEMREEEKRIKLEEEQAQQELEQKLLFEQIRADITNDVTSKFENVVKKLQDELGEEKQKNVKISRTKMFMDEARAKLKSSYILDEDNMGEVPGQRVNKKAKTLETPPTTNSPFRLISKDSVNKITGFLKRKKDRDEPLQRNVDNVNRNARRIPKEMLTNQTAKRIVKRTISKWMRQRYYSKYKDTSYLRVQILSRIIDDCDDIYIATIALSTALDNNDSQLAVSACKSLAHILSVDSSRDKDIQIAYLVEAAYTFRENPAVILHISNCVSNLCSSATKALSSTEAENFTSPIISINMKKLNELFDVGVIEMLLHACTQHASNVGCMYAVTKAMQRLAECHVQSRHRLGSDTACDALNLVCDEHLNNLQILENIMKTIINLCSNSQENQNKIGSHGLCTSIVSAMHEHKLEQNFVKMTSKVVTILCKDGHKSNQVRFSSNDNPLKLIQVLLNQVKNPKLFEQLSWAIISMIVTSQENSRAFNNAGVSEILLKIVALEFPVNEKVMVQSTLILSYCIDEINPEQTELNSKLYEALRKLERKGPSAEIKKIAKFAIGRAFPSKIEITEGEIEEELFLEEPLSINSDEYYNASSNESIVVIDKLETTSVNDDNHPNKVNNFLRDIPIDAVTDQQHRADLEAAKLEMEERLRLERVRFEDEQRELEERIHLERLHLEKEQSEFIEKLKADLERSKEEIEAKVQASISSQFERKLKDLELDLENERKKYVDISHTRKYLDQTREKLKLRYILEDDEPEDVVSEVSPAASQSKNMVRAKMLSMAASMVPGKGNTNADDKSVSRTVPKSLLSNAKAKRILRSSLSKFLRLRYYKKYKHTNYLRVQILFRIIETLDNVHVLNIAIATSLDDSNLTLGLAACKTLEQVTSNDSSRDKEVHGGLLIEAAHAFKENPFMILHISNIISNLCTAATLTLDSSAIDSNVLIPVSENLRKINEMFDVGACEILSEACVIHITHSSCVYAVTKAMQRLAECHVQSRHLFGVDAACDALQKVCEEHKNNPQIQENILKSIITISTNSEENQNHLGCHGLCTSVLLVMSENRVDENIIKIGCKCIISLCANNHKQNQIRFSSGDNPTIICQILLNFIKKPKIFEQISWAILTLVTTSRDNSNNFNDSGLVDVLSKIVSLDVTCHDKVIIQSALMLSYILDELNTSQLDKNKELFNSLKQLESNGTSIEVKKAAKFALSRAFPITYDEINGDN